MYPLNAQVRTPQERYSVNLATVSTGIRKDTDVVSMLMCRADNFREKEWLGGPC
jgi:hypothetical protein